MVPIKSALHHHTLEVSGADLLLHRVFVKVELLVGLEQILLLSNLGLESCLPHISHSPMLSCSTPWSETDLVEKLNQVHIVLLLSEMLLEQKVD